MAGAMNASWTGRKRARYLRPAPLVFALAATQACSDVQPAPDFVVPPDGIVHPEASSLQSRTFSGPVVVVEGTVPNELPPHLVQVTTFDGVRAFGALDGDPAEILGGIIDAAVLSDNRVALLDANYGNVRLLSTEGEAPVTIGGFGDGPGQFVQPQSLSPTAAGGLLVLDQGGMRIDLFTKPLSSGESVRANISVAYSYGACAIGERLFVTGLRRGHEVTAPFVGTDMVHEIDRDGAILRSFSQPYARMSDPLVATTYSAAPMTCDRGGSGSIWVAYSMLGEVHAFGPEGDLRWISVLADVQIPRQLQLPGRIGVFPGQGDTVEHITSISLLSAQALAVQVKSRTLQPDGPRRWRLSYRTYLLNPTDGTLIGSFSSAHQIVGGGGGRVILYREEPFPQVAVKSIGDGREL